MNDVPQFVTHALHSILLSGVFLCFVSGGLAVLSGRARTALPMLFGSMMLLGLGRMFVFNGSPEGAWLASAVDVGRLLSTMAPLLGGLLIGAFLGLAFALMLKKLLE